jgi:hypothetical protein
VAILVLSRWAAKRGQIEQISRTVKPIFEKHGVKFEIGQIFSGENAGEYIAVVCYHDWERFGRAMYAMAKDADYQEIMAEAYRMCELRSRRVVITMDLSGTIETKESPAFETLVASL